MISCGLRALFKTLATFDIVHVAGDFAELVVGQVQVDTFFVYVIASLRTVDKDFVFCADFVQSCEFHQVAEVAQTVSSDLVLGVRNDVLRG